MSLTKHYAIAHLELLPTNILSMIADRFRLWKIRLLSLVSKRLREVCLPFLFGHNEFQFSEAGFDELESFLTLDVRHHVVFLAYVVPELLKTGEELSGIDQFELMIL